jgi:hypothetical protein
VSPASPLYFFIPVSGGGYFVSVFLVCVVFFCFCFWPAYTGPGAYSYTPASAPVPSTSLFSSRGRGPGLGRDRWDGGRIGRLPRGRYPSPVLGSPNLSLPNLRLRLRSRRWGCVSRLSPGDVDVPAEKENRGADACVWAAGVGPGPGACGGSPAWVFRRPVQGARRMCKRDWRAGVVQIQMR